jgi:hypothetical protein
MPKVLRRLGVLPARRRIFVCCHDIQGERNVPVPSPD